MVRLKLPNYLKVEYNGERYLIDTGTGNCYNLDSKRVPANIEETLIGRYKDVLDPDVLERRKPKPPTRRKGSVIGKGNFEAPGDYWPIAQKPAKSDGKSQETLRLVIKNLMQTGNLDRGDLLPKNVQRVIGVIRSNSPKYWESTYGNMDHDEIEKEFVEVLGTF